MHDNMCAVLRCEDTRFVTLAASKFVLLPPTKHRTKQPMAVDRCLKWGRDIASDGLGQGYSMRWMWSKGMLISGRLLELTKSVINPRMPFVPLTQRSWGGGIEYMRFAGSRENVEKRFDSTSGVGVLITQ